MQFRNKVWLGAAAGAGVSGVWGDSNTEFQDRLMQGGALGAGLAAFTDWRGVKNLATGAGGLAFKGLNSYRGAMTSHYGELRKGGLPAWKAAAGAFGRLPVLAGTGAAVGALLDKDNHKRGAMIGAGVGVAARVAIAGRPAWKEMTKPWQIGGKLPISKKLFVAAGISAAAYGIASHQASSQVTAEAVYNPVTGYDEAAPGSSVKDRLNSMNATGSVVFGAHARRRG